MNESIEFYFFSGTGNTMLVAKRMSRVFQSEGFNVKLKRIENSNPADVDTECTIGLGFPVAILSTYDLVWKFINELPQVDGTEVFMVDTLGGYSGGIIGPLKTLLESKGYKTIGACEIIMPLNIFYIENDNTNTKKIEEGLVKAENYAIALVNNESEWGRVPVLPDLMRLISKIGLRITATDVHQKILKFKVNPSSCTKCGICGDICPLNNVKLAEYPVTGNNCEYCMRCVSMCPAHAIRSMITYKGKTYSAVKSKEFK
jgi:NAD-dependent dihydropyrimidine dehydrogenase PreA subunit